MAETLKALKRIMWVLGLKLRETPILEQVKAVRYVTPHALPVLRIGSDVVTNSGQKHLSWEADSRAGYQEISPWKCSIAWIFYPVPHENGPRTYTHTHTHTPTSNFIKIYFVLFVHCPFPRDEKIYSFLGVFEELRKATVSIILY